MKANFSIMSISDIVIAQVRGMPTESFIREMQAEIRQRIDANAGGKVLYNALEMEVPPVEIPLSQQKLDQEMPIKVKRAIVVPSTRLAYLARLAFGNGPHRVFYHDITGALTWLQREEAFPAPSIKI